MKLLSTTEIWYKMLLHKRWPQMWMYVYHRDNKSAKFFRKPAFVRWIHQQNCPLSLSMQRRVLHVLCYISPITDELDRRITCTGTMYYADPCYVLLVGEHWHQFGTGVVSLHKVMHLTRNICFTSLSTHWSVVCAHCQTERSYTINMRTLSPPNVLDR